MKLGIRIFVREQYLLKMGYKPQWPHTYSTIKYKQFVTGVKLPRYHIIQVKHGEFYLHYDFWDDGHKTKTNFCDEVRQEIKRLNCKYKI